jgi:cellulose synthase/poly-beta-1,6-N-acetylglucosamine synthase-like glycosyltransferase
LKASYVLPLRWTSVGPIEELNAYLRSLPEEVAEVIVVDGSPAELFDSHAAVFDGAIRHLSPDPKLDFAMGKVNGIVTGVRACSCEYVVLADDDVRYDPDSLRRAVELLEGADLVRPQNYFEELPWHARWDTARSLLNRVFTGDLTFPVGDFPGTLGVRRDSFLACGAYDGNAMFENLELMRTIHAAGGTVSTALDLYVPRQAPSATHFLSQRVRQAYDDFAVPLRMAAFLAILPLTADLARRRRLRSIVLPGAASIAVAEAGRRRSGGASHFPLTSSLLAPAWIAERAICSWLALGSKLAGGVRYGPGRVTLSANSVRHLRRRSHSRHGNESTCVSRRRTGGSSNDRSDRARSPGV